MRTAAAVSVLLVGAFLGWAVWTTVAAANDLDEVQESALVLRRELEEGDATGAARALDRYQENAGAARDRMDGPTWWVIEHLPVIGDDAEAVATAAEVLADLGEEGVPELVDAAELVAARSFNPDDHVFPVETIASVTEPARESEEAFADAAATLEAVDESKLTRTVGARFVQLRNTVLSARATLGAAYRAAELMPSLLGTDGARNHLLVFQNNAELRSLGGLAGSVSLIHAEDGEVRILEQEGTSKYGGLERPVIKLTRGERDLFGDTLGQWFMNASMSPDVPRAALLAGTRWEREVGGTVDGVFFVDPVAVSYLLTATGPVEVPGYGSVSEADIVAKVENQIYLTEPDVGAQEDYQNAVADAVFDAFAAGRGDPVEVIRMLVRGVAEGRIRMHSFVEQEQAQIAGTEIAGELNASDEEAQVGIYLNDALESKMTYYLDYEATAVAQECVGRTQQIVGSLLLTHVVPADEEISPLVSGVFPGKRFYGEVESGQQRIAVYLVAPAGGTFDRLALDSRQFDPVVAKDLDGRQVAQVVTVIDQGETQRVDFELTAGLGQTGAIELDVTPGAFPGSSSTVLRSAC